jgi:CHAD domain-containing protein
MVQPRKWLTGTSPDQLLTETARQALSARLGMVWHFLVQANAQGVNDREAIHQLRVWSRRTVAALQTFDDTLPPRRAAWLHKQLGRVRRAAGEARDLDVLAHRFEERSERAGAADVSHALGRLRDDRRRAQPPIERIHRRLRGKRFDRRVAGLIERIAWRGQGQPQTLGDAARLRLGQALGPLFDAAKGDLSDVTALHQLRIEGKRVRYAMELFAGAFDPSFREQLYPMVEQLQERLGQINDHAAAAERFQRWLAETTDPAATDEFKRLLATERAAMRRARRGFFSWWTPERLAELERGFTRALRDADNKAAG